MTKTTFDNELAARRYMMELQDKGVRFDYWHRSICEHIVTAYGRGRFD